jgi:hypothetical protein
MIKKNIIVRFILNNILNEYILMIRSLKKNNCLKMYYIIFFQKYIKYFNY